MTALAVAAPEVVVSAGFIVAAFILLLATAYVLTHMRSFQQAIMALIERAREMTRVQARARSLPKQKYFDPKCKPLYDSFMQVTGKMIQRADLLALQVVEIARVGGPARPCAGGAAPAWDRPSPCARAPS